MACTPIPTPNAGLFENASQGIWLNANEAKGPRSCTYSSGTLTVTAPNGNETFSASAGVTVRHKFFGTTNYLAVLVSDAGPGSVQRWMYILDFTAPSLTAKLVLQVLADSTNSPPWLQHSATTGHLCLVGGPTPTGVAGLQILRSDTGALVCPGPSPFVPSQQVIGEATATAVQIKHGGAIIAGPCPLPSGELDVQPATNTFTTVKVGGCAQSPSTKQFTLKNTGNDCLTVSAIGNVAPYAVTGQSLPFPSQLAPGQSMTVTVTFAPTAIGTFNNVSLPVTRTPAKGDGALVCSGLAQAAQPAFTVTSPVNFGQVPVGSTDTGSFVVKNTGDLPTSVSVPSPPGGSPFQWAAWSGTLTCGQQQSVPVTFAPAAEGPASEVIAVTASPGGAKNVTLLGEGCVANAAVVVPPAPFPAFGDVRQGFRMPRFITIDNVGDDTLTFTASISGPDAALFGLMKTSQSITDVVASRSYTVDPRQRCGPGAIGDGREEVVVVFFANAAPPATATATLTIDAHNDPAQPASFTRPLTANVIAGTVVDAVAVFDTSGSMNDPVPGGGTKMAAAIQAGKLFVNLLPPDLGNRAAAIRFSTTASTFIGMTDVTSGSQAGMVGAIANPPLSPLGATAIAAGAMTGLPEFAVPRAGAAPASLTKAMVVLTDGMDNTAFKNPADGKFYSILGVQSFDPGNLSTKVATSPFMPPSDVDIYAIGLGTGQDIDKMQLEKLSSSAGGYYGAVDPTQTAVTYQLMKFYTQIYMDLVDTSTIKDPRDVIGAGDKHTIEFDVLQGDVSGTVVMYDFDGMRLPFWLETPLGEVVDASFVPPGFQLRAGATETTRFLDFLLPLGEPKRYAGRWRLVVVHDGRVCFGRPEEQTGELGYLPRECRETRDAIEYGFAVGVGSNFRLNAFVTAGPVKVGDPIRLTGLPTEATLPVLGCTLTVDVTAPNGQTWSGLVLVDDGVHDDGDADDGDYAALFTKTQVAGSYTFRFRATGYTRDGEPVTRETVRSKYVEGTVREPPTGDPSDNCCEETVSILRRHTKALEDIRRALGGKEAPKAARLAEGGSVVKPKETRT